MRARSRHEVMMNPSDGNGYEKHHGSPQRYSPKRDTYEQSRQTYQPPPVYSTMQDNRSPLRETQNLKSVMSYQRREIDEADGKAGTRDTAAYRKISSNAEVPTVN